MVSCSPSEVSPEWEVDLSSGQAVEAEKQGGRKKILINEHYSLVVNISGVEDYGKTSTCPSGGVDVRGGWALGGIMLGICGCSFGTWFLFSRNDWAGLRLICIGTQEGSMWLFFFGGGSIEEYLVHREICIVTSRSDVFQTSFTSSTLSCPFLLKRGGTSLDWACCWIWFWKSRFCPFGNKVKTQTPIQIK